MPLQPGKSDTRNLETAANFVRTNCAWSDRLHARACKHRQRHPPCNSSRCKAACRSFRMKTRRSAYLSFHSDRTAAAQSFRQNIDIFFSERSERGDYMFDRLIKSDARLNFGNERHVSVVVMQFG